LLRQNVTKNTLRTTGLKNKPSGRSEGRNFFYERKGGLGDNGGLFGPVGVGKFCSLPPQKGMVEPFFFFFLFLEVQFF
jgi:hypothetical protein